MGKILFLLLLIQIGGVWCLLLDLIRGERDKFKVSTVDGCDDDYCSCKNLVQKTYVYDSSSSSGKCVADRDLIDNWSAGKWLPEPGEKCLGVEDDNNLEASNCSDPKDTLSVRWLWIKTGHILSLKTLKCLEANENSAQTVVLRQCRYLHERQIWSVGSRPERNNVIRNYAMNVEKRWIKSKPSSNFYSLSDLSSDKLNPEPYQGCYRLTNGKFMAEVYKSETCSRPGKVCTHEFAIRAPILYRNHTKCSLERKSSTYSLDGYKWMSFTTNITDIFSLHYKSNEEITLKIKNEALLFGNLSGCILRVSIKCQAPRSTAEVHCTLLKISGSQMKPISIEETPTSSDSPSMDLHIFLIPVCVLICVILLVIGLVVLYRKRKRSDQKGEVPLYEGVYEESKPTPQNTTQPCDDHTYTYAGDKIYTGPDYTCPSDNAGNLDSRKSPSTTQDLAYDYATREETPLIPLILNGTILLDPPSEKQTVSGNGSVDEPNIMGSNSSDVNREGQIEQSGGKPVYHTLHDNGDDAGNSHNRRIPFYHTLEKDRTESKDGETVMQPNSVHVYNVLEKPRN